MSYLKKITFSIATLTFIFALQSASAQDIDNNRMERDINIMENILHEMFKTQIKGSGDNIRIHSIGSYTFDQEKNIRGTYLPGYGIIFNVNSGSHPFILFQDDDNTFSYSFQYGESENGEKVTEESITNRIVEFLKDYGSTISQLSGDDKVTVIYNSNKPEQETSFLRFRGDDEIEMKQQITPAISVVATVNDLQAYRSGDISDADFQDRLDISAAETNKLKQKDLRIMAGIFETAFEDTGEKSFQITGTVDYLKLDNFGALFSFDTRYAGQSGFNFSNLHISLDAAKGKLEEARKRMEKTRAQIDEDFDIDIDLSDSVGVGREKQTEANRAKEKEKIKKAYDQFLADLKSTIADYGRTLHSIHSNQQILVTVNLHGRHEDIPDRIDLQVRKSALENSSRDQAINQITVRKY